MLLAKHRCPELFEGGDVPPNHTLGQHRVACTRSATRFLGRNATGSAAFRAYPNRRTPSEVVVRVELVDGDDAQARQAFVEGAHVGFQVEELDAAGAEVAQADTHELLEADQADAASVD